MPYLANLKHLCFGAAAVAATAVGGCQQASWPVMASGGQHGRYFGVGIYTPGEQWAKLVAPAPTGHAAATLADDQAIVVVIDSTTGEVRACGDLSGYCIGMNPWRAALVRAQTTPVAMSAHKKPPKDDDMANVADNALNASGGN